MRWGVATPQRAHEEIPTDPNRFDTARMCSRSASTVHTHPCGNASDHVHALSWLFDLTTGANGANGANGVSMTPAAMTPVAMLSIAHLSEPTARPPLRTAPRTAPPHSPPHCPKTVKRPHSPKHLRSDA